MLLLSGATAWLINWNISSFEHGLGGSRIRTSAAALEFGQPVGKLKASEEGLEQALGLEIIGP